jgi:hypothetical protein
LLESVSLDVEVLPFAALSYTWGSPDSPRRKITCNGHEFLVTKSLYGALGRIRDKDHPAALWIDQICINQEDKLEKNQQVPLMREIYTKAFQVFVWLGEAENHSRNALTLLYQIVTMQEERAKKEGRAVTPWIENSHISPIWQHPRAWGSPNWFYFSKLLPDHTWSAVRPFYQRQWFNRIWIIQEVALSDHIVVFCGDDYLPWKYVANFVAYIPPVLPSRFYGMDPQRKGLATYQPQAISEIGRLRKEGQSPRLLDLVLEHRRCGATDPRDKIYGLLGMGNYNIPVDYSKPTEELYKDFAIQHILHGASSMSIKDISDQEASHDVFRILYSAGRLGQKFSLPSWVPDWSVDFRSTPLWPVNKWGLEDQEFCASGKPRAILNGLKVYGTTSLDFLDITGIKWEAVKATGTVLLDLSALKSRRRRKRTIITWIQEAINIAKLHKSKPYPTGVTHEDAFKQTLLLNRKALGVSALSWNFELTDRKPLRKLCQRRAFAEWLWDAHPRHKDSYIDAVANANGRAFFVTESGFMGLGPHGIRAGDVVCVILGGDVPVVLRPKGDKFTLLGECYTDGVMKGELMEGNNIPLATITLV